ncbi:MAG TPA: hypothetical protein VNR70_02195 [Steroidobacteraceae bacterium]|nr:hypothetical protein [Steroidobacteraceae bacterium]
MAAVVPPEELEPAPLDELELLVAPLELLVVPEELLVVPLELLVVPEELLVVPEELLVLPLELVVPDELVVPLLELVVPDDDVVVPEEELTVPPLELLAASPDPSLSLQAARMPDNKIKPMSRARNLIASARAPIFFIGRLEISIELLPFIC